MRQVFGAMAQSGVTGNQRNHRQTRKHSRRWKGFLSPGSGRAKPSR